jgi:hypothetical protein
MFPFLIIPMGVANLISNTLMGGFGIFDMVGGAIVGMIATGSVALIGKLDLHKSLIIVPVILIPGLIVPIWLSIMIHVPYTILAVSLCIGQITPAMVGYILVNTLKIKYREVTYYN